jgi:glucose-1-phosphate adenylyltransferase
MPGHPELALASMGNYLFNTDVLVREVTRDARDDTSNHDFGKNILSAMFERSRVFGYDFATNAVPGQGTRERGYWRDVGTIEAYFQANMDLVAVEPIFNLYNPKWPIYTHHPDLPPAKFVFADFEENRAGYATDSLVSEGCIVSGGRVNRSVLSPMVRVNSYSEVTDSILMENVEIGRHCVIRRAIIDKNVSIPPHTRIGVDLAEDQRRFVVTEDGLVIIPKGMKVA